MRYGYCSTGVDHVTHSAARTALRSRIASSVRPHHARGAAAASVPRDGRHARAWEKFRGGSLLDRGPLSLREREIVIDRTCALNGCEYEWGVHVATFSDAAHLTA